MLAALIEFHESIRKKVLGKVNWYQHTKKCITLYGLIEHVASAKTHTVAYVRLLHDDAIKWKHFPRYLPFMWGIQRSPVDSPHIGQ